jgi:hypothetical protein
LRHSSDQSISLYNASTQATKVAGRYRWIGPQFRIGRIVTEHISAPSAGQPIPTAGAA